MKNNHPVLATAFIVSIGILPAHAAVMAQWTFETSVPTTAGPHAAEGGTGSALGFHASASTVYSNPAGNGSLESFSSNFWAVGDYYQFTTNSTGFEGIAITFDQTGSNSGPRDFKLQYSNDGITFTDFASYSLPGPSAITWNTSTPVVPASTSFSFDLSAITALDNDSSIFFRLTNTTTVAINGGTVATGGTGRVDNVVIATIPEPTTALLGALGCLALLRRRR
jgi:hypothetical protein